MEHSDELKTETPSEEQLQKDIKYVHLTNIIKKHKNEQYFNIMTIYRLVSKLEDFTCSGEFTETIS